TISAVGGSAAAIRCTRAIRTTRAGAFTLTGRGRAPVAMPIFFRRHAQWRNPPSLNPRPIENSRAVSSLSRNCRTRSAHFSSVAVMPPDMRLYAADRKNGVCAAGTRYQANKLAGLKRAPRRDRGQMRNVVPAALARAVALRKEEPARSTRTLIDALERA